MLLLPVLLDAPGMSLVLLLGNWCSLPPQDNFSSGCGCSSNWSEGELWGWGAQLEVTKHSLSCSLLQANTNKCSIEQCTFHICVIRTYPLYLSFLLVLGWGALIRNVPQVRSLKKREEQLMFVGLWDVECQYPKIRRSSGDLEGITSSLPINGNSLPMNRPTGILMFVHVFNLIFRSGLIGWYSLSIL